MDAILTKYFKLANERAIDEQAGLFSEDAVVQDEGGEYVGTTSIRGWIEATTAKYEPRYEVVNWAPKDRATAVTVSVEGNFDGSPVELEFLFSLSEGKIARLAIS